VANKIINGKQATIAWYVNDLKISHAYADVNNQIIQHIQKEFGSQMDVTFKRGPVHDYLGMTSDFSEKGQVQLTMFKYIDEILLECPDDLMKGVSLTPAASHLFAADPKCKGLDRETSVLFHRLTAKLLYLYRRTLPDLQLVLSFLTKRVAGPDHRNWKDVCVTSVTRDSYL
jgi:hypothetical protein